MLTLSKTVGIGGRLKLGPEDFVVNEITKSGITLELNTVYSPEALSMRSGEGKFTVFVLQKRMWNTSDALIKIAKLLGRGKKSIGYAGAKDRLSLSVQLASIFGVEPGQVMGVRLKDIAIGGAWKSAEGVRIGDLLGNRFTIKVTGATDIENIEKINEELNGRFPNYFDRQRFGLRLNNVKIGVYILKGDFKSAVMEFLTSIDGEENEAAREARQRLNEEQDFSKALKYFPKYLRHERSMISYLSRFPGNYANALRSIPRGIALMMVHSVEGYIFNRLVECIVRGEESVLLSCSHNFYGFPEISTVSEGAGEFPVGSIIGYQTEESHISKCERETMESMGISKESFKIHSMPELSMKGTYRPILVPFNGFSYSMSGKDVSLSFSIPNGAYATILMNEFMKNMSFDIKIPG